MGTSSHRVQYQWPRTSWDNCTHQEKWQCTCGECSLMLSTILTWVVFPQRDIFITTSDIVVTVGSEFNSLYSIQDSKMHDKQLVLPRQQIKMDLESVSRPFYDRGFNWMVILCKYEFFLIRLPKDLSSPPRIITPGRNPAEPGHGWLPGLIRGDACNSSSSFLWCNRWRDTWGSDVVVRGKHGRMT